MSVEKNIGFGGIGEVLATFKVASDTTATVGMAVAFTGNGEVGKGVSAGALGGIIKTISKNGLVGVQVNGFCENVPITSTATNYPIVGGLTSIDGTGKLVKATTATYGAKVISVDTTALTATILL